MNIPSNVSLISAPCKFWPLAVPPCVGKALLATPVEDRSGLDEVFLLVSHLNVGETNLRFLDFEIDTNSILLDW